MIDRIFVLFILLVLILFSPIILFPSLTDHGSIRESYQMWKEDLKMCMNTLRGKNENQTR